MNLMFESAIRQGKALPSFAGTAAHEVRLTLHGTVASPAFVRFIEQLGEEKLKSFSTYDFLALDHLRREQSMPEHLKACLPGLVAAGAVESIGGDGEPGTSWHAGFTPPWAARALTPARRGSTEGPTRRCC
jgi:ATP-dependent DNA helicase RecG